MVKWLRKHITAIGVSVVLGTAIALYLLPSNPSRPSWGLFLVALGPAVTWLTSRVQQKGRNNENLIRQLGPLVDDGGDLEFTIRSFVRDLVNKPDVQPQLGGGPGVQGWSSYIESTGAWQLDALRSLKSDLKEADPFEQAQVINVITSFYKILGRILEVESRFVAVCQKINNLPPEAQGRWENIQQVHQRLGTQLRGLKPMLNEIGRGDTFDTFISQPPQNLKPTV